MQKTIEYLKDRISIQPEIGLVLGSGLGVLAEEISEAIYLPYSEIPGFPLSTVEGHLGRLVIGNLVGVPVLVMQGRFHYYEGYDLQTVTFPIRIMQGLGIKKLLVTNAAGGINLDYSAGALMLIEDHINLTGVNPLIGLNDKAFGPRFPDMTFSYSPDYLALAKKKASLLGISVKSGVYVGLTGPSYETPAEINFLRIIGGDAVGMSTVPEVIVARHSGMKVLGISCITNMASGISGQSLNHEEVMATAKRVHQDFRALVLAIIGDM